MIRQEEQQSRLMVKVLIDPSDSSSHEYESCIRSAASVLRSFSRKNHPTRLVEGPRPAASSVTQDTYHHAMQRLAACTHNPQTDISHLWLELGDGLIVVVCARPHMELVRRIARDRSLAKRTVVIAHGKSASTLDDARMEAIRRAGSIGIEVPATDSLGSVWRLFGDVGRSPRALAR